MSELILTTGVQGGDLVARQEIRTFAKDRDLMDLFILALQRFQSVDQKSPHSWFQIAGIHGRFVVTSSHFTFYSNLIFFVLFFLFSVPILRMLVLAVLATWVDIALTVLSFSLHGQSFRYLGIYFDSSSFRHRPYLALFEQHLYKHVTDIANEYPADSKARYTAAAKRFRTP